MPMDGYWYGKDNMEDEQIAPNLTTNIYFG